MIRQGNGGDGGNGKGFKPHLNQLSRRGLAENAESRDRRGFANLGDPHHAPTASRVQVRFGLGDLCPPRPPRELFDMSACIATGWSVNVSVRRPELPGLKFADEFGNLAEVVAKVVDVVAHEEIERHGFVARHFRKRDLIEVVACARP